MRKQLLFKAEDDPTKFYQLFSRYIASKVTYSYPNIAYLSSYLCLRKLWQCRNSTFGTIQKDLHKQIRLKLNIYTFWPSKFWWHSKQLAKNPEKCAINSIFKAKDDPTKIGPISTSRSATIKVVGFGCLRLYIETCIGDIRTINRAKTVTWAEAEDTPMCVYVLMLPISLCYQYSGHVRSSEWYQEGVVECERSRIGMEH